MPKAYSVGDSMFVVGLDDAGCSKGKVNIFPTRWDKIAPVDTRVIDLKATRLPNHGSLNLFQSLPSRGFFDWH